MCDQTVDSPSHFLLCSIRVRTCEVSFLRRCWKQMVVARVDGWMFSHTGEDQIDIEDNVWGWVVTMIYDHDPWSWWGYWVWHWPSATAFSMIASEIQTSFNLQVSSFKPTRFLAIWSVSICDGSSNWIGYAWMRLRSTICQAPMQCLLQGASSLRQSPWCEDTVPVGSAERRKCWKNHTMQLCYTRLPSRGPNISHLGKRKFKSALGCWREKVI